MPVLLMADVLKTIHSLPSLPAVVLDLLASMEQDDVDIDTLARKIALDQVLTAKTLRLANSSFYGMQRQVNTVGEAISVLGLRSVRNLATTAALMGHLANGASGSFCVLAFWRHSIGTALCAQALAAHLGLNKDQAYTTGLLHDIGRLVLATRFAGDYSAVMAHRAAHKFPVVEAEQAVLGLDHTAVGEALALHWKFPEAMQRAVARHHASGLPGEDAMAQLICVADATAHALGFSSEEDDQAEPVAQTTWQSLGLDEKMQLAAFKDAERQFEAACSVLAP